MVACGRVGCGCQLCLGAVAEGAAACSRAARGSHDCYGVGVESEQSLKRGVAHNSQPARIVGAAVGPLVEMVMLCRNGG